MKLLKRILKSEAGQALPMALILLVLGGLLVVPTLAFMTTNLTANRIVKEKNLATYAADAGVEEVLWNIKYNQGTGFTLPTVSTPEQPVVNRQQVNDRINDRTIVATISKQGAYYRIISTATSADGKTTRIDAWVSKASGLFDNALTAMGQYGPGAYQGYSIVTAGGSGTGVIDSLPSDPNSVIIFANGKINLPQSDVKGHVKASGTINVLLATDPLPPYPAAANLAGPYDFSSLIQTMQSVYIDPAKVEAQNVTPPADFPINRGLPGSPGSPNWTINVGGTYFTPPNGDRTGGDFSITAVTGDVTIGGTPQDKGALIVDGKLTAGGYHNQTFNGPVYVKGDVLSKISVKANQVVTFNDIVYIDGNLEIGGPSGSTSTINFNGDVYVSGYIHTTDSDPQVNFNRNLYVGGKHLSSNYVLRLEGNNITFGGIVYAKDTGAGRGPTDTTFKCSAHNLKITGGGPIIIKNRIDIEGGNAALDKMPLIMSESGNIQLGGTNIISYLYAPYGEVHTGGGNVTGGITANTIRIASNLLVTYAILPVPGGSGGFPVIAYSIQ